MYVSSGINYTEFNLTGILYSLLSMILVIVLETEREYVCGGENRVNVFFTFSVEHYDNYFFHSTMN